MLIKSEKQSKKKLEMSTKCNAGLGKQKAKTRMTIHHQNLDDRWLPMHF
jgi:hypothetical protein